MTLFLSPLSWYNIRGSDSGICGTTEKFEQVLGSCLVACSVDLYVSQVSWITWKFSRWNLLSPTRWGIVQAWWRLICVWIVLRQTSAELASFRLRGLGIYILGNPHDMTDHRTKVVQKLSLNLYLLVDYVVRTECQSVHEWLPDWWAHLDYRHDT